MGTVWGPSFRVTLFALLTVRLISAAWNQIHDCDEVFNYWEPLHFLAYGHGFQTWEYAGQYALRSYAYLFPHYMIVKVSQYLASPNDKIWIFFGVRAVLASFSALSEAVLIEGVGKTFGKRCSNLTTVMLLSSAAMFCAASTFLPSTFAMYFITLSTGFLLADRYCLAMFSAACSILVGWPFSALALAPHALVLLLKAGLFNCLKWGFSALFLFIVPSIAVDWYYYGRPLVAILNIFVYNATASHEGGSQLYGVEPPHYYFVNLGLYFNIVLPLALLGIPAVLLLRGVHRWPMQSVFLVFSSIIIWMAFFSYLPHKEERFMYPIYPLLCVGAGLCLSVIRSACNVVLGKYCRRFWIVYVVVLGSFALIGASRVYSMHANYNKPIYLYTRLAHEEIIPLGSEHSALQVCVGKEWYRFPSSFFLPEQPRTRLQFLKSGFDGQLPTQFLSGPHATSARRENFNDRNREEPDRYVDTSACDYIVDLIIDNQVEQRYDQSPDWSLLFEEPFLDAVASHNRVARAFHIPGYSAHFSKMGTYVVLKRNKP